MESVDSSPDHHRNGIKKETYQGGSEYDDVISVTSTCASVDNGLYTRKASKSGIKYRTNNKKVLKNVRSLQRRAKSRVVQPYIDSSYSQESPIHESGQSPNYLKATNSSEGKKSNFSSSNGSVNGGSEHNSSHSSPIHGSMRSVSRTSVSSVRNVGILLRKTSFKPKRPLLAYSQVTEDASVDRATYSSTLKDSKFSKPVETPMVEVESESSPGMKICRYHHCSLHGHCHGTVDSVPPPKRFLYRKRSSVKKQKSIRPKRASSSKTKFTNENQKTVERKMSSISTLAGGVVNEKGLVHYEETRPEQIDQSFGDGYLDLEELGLVEIAFGEMSFPDRSYRETLEILDKHSVKKQDLGRSVSGLKGYCLKCSCSITEQIMSPSQNADMDLLSADRDADGRDPDTHSLAFSEKLQEQAILHIDDSATLDEEDYGNDGSDKDSPDTPIIFDTVRKNSGLNSSASHSRTTSENNSLVDGDTIAESCTANSKRDSDVGVKDSEIQSPVIKGSVLQFSKPRHISMWHLIHEHMSSDSATEVAKKPDESTDDKSQDDVAAQVPPKEGSESDMMAESNGSEVQEIELRKLFAIKLVREAIEKILLPEVQDQASDDQSVTSETPRPEVIAKNQSDVFNQESCRGSADSKTEEVKSVPKEETVTVDVASGTEIVESGKLSESLPKKKAPRHWSNLKKWILLQKFIRELEKVRTFNPRKPRYLPLSPDPEAEKVNLRAQTVDGKKKSEEWMLDYALQQAVSQLAPTQKKKVALLVRAFETVVPPQEEPQNPVRIPSFKILELVSEGNATNKAVTFGGKDKLSGSDTASSLNFEIQESGSKLTNKSVSDLNEGSEEISTTDKSIVSSMEGSVETDYGSGERSLETQSLIPDGNGNLETSETLLSSDSFGTQLEKIMTDEIKTQTDQGESGEENKPQNAVEKQNRVKMWHMIYQHVVSGIAEKVGSKILEGSDDDEVEETECPSPSPTTTSDFSKSKDHVQENNVSSNQKIAFLKLVKDAVDEILLPETPDDSSDTRSPSSETSPAQETNKFEPQKSKNWSKLKKHLVLQRSIRALQMGGKPKPKPQPVTPQMPDPEPEKIDLRNQMMDERKKAEQWMLDYAVQHIVTKLTPARKRRVSMLVEAFEAVVPLPET